MTSRGPSTLFSSRQALAARMLLRWSRDLVAERAGLEAEAVELYETGRGDLGDAEKAALAAALWDGGHGAIAINPNLAGEGVRLAQPPPAEASPWR